MIYEDIKYSLIFSRGSNDRFLLSHEQEHFDHLKILQTSLKQQAAKI